MIDTKPQAKFLPPLPTVFSPRMSQFKKNPDEFAMYLSDVEFMDKYNSMPFYGIMDELLGEKLDDSPEWVQSLTNVLFFVRDIFPDAPIQDEEIEEIFLMKDASAEAAVLSFADNAQIFRVLIKMDELPEHILVALFMRVSPYDDDIFPEIIKSEMHFEILKHYIGTVDEELTDEQVELLENAPEVWKNFFDV